MDESCLFMNILIWNVWPVSLFTCELHRVAKQHGASTCSSGHHQKSNYYVAAAVAAVAVVCVMICSFIQWGSEMRERPPKKIASRPFFFYYIWYCDHLHSAEAVHRRSGGAIHFLLIEVVKSRDGWSYSSAPIEYQRRRRYTLAAMRRSCYRVARIEEEAARFNYQLGLVNLSSTRPTVAERV